LIKHSIEGGRRWAMQRTWRPWRRKCPGRDRASRRLRHRFRRLRATLIWRGRQRQSSLCLMATFVPLKKRWGRCGSW
jgi:hypothetical protein